MVVALGVLQWRLLVRQGGSELTPRALHGLTGRTQVSWAADEGSKL